MKYLSLKVAFISAKYQLRIFNQMKISICPFDAHFGRKPNVPLDTICTVPKSSNLSYEKILNIT